MIAGKLRHRAEFLKSQTGQDDTGAPIKEWKVYFERRFRLAQSAGKEFLSAQQRTNEMTHLFVFRHINLPAKELVSYRIDYDGRRFDVLSAINFNERDRETQLSVREIV